MSSTDSTPDRPFILICNDDGIDAPGIQALATALDGHGDLCVVAPEREQSAVGHAITVRDPVRAHRYEFEVPSGPIPAWAVSGTPADCIKLATHQLLDRRPDVVVSGINRGPNTAVNILYSGTVSAATEAAILGFDAVAVSLCSFTRDEYEAAGRFAEQIVDRVLAGGLPPGVLLNVNVPAYEKSEIKGIRVTRQARSRWEESFEARVDPFDRPYYWIAGKFVNLDDGDETDLEAIENGYVSVTPIQFDLTAYEHLKSIRDWQWNGEE
ncbi:5'/3'-nucleotidase SurE [Longibacter salinarum]|uniref:5'-nucleotidase SurE n=1 Tax=Longibacter salinarum TaxID=1850348 RepID=A0A2A8CW15_9BACT|nr:5'/3'-nucleotidase SurE [Longibacter salinarum]PEN12801.1 5'/3'-nucleotidase SurE [Longibacter salinarum]